MRVTYNSINRQVQRTLLDRYEDLSMLQYKLSTGKELLRPSDGPIDVANDLKLRSKLSQLVQYNKNIDDGSGFMEVTDSAMMSMNDVMQRLRELAIKASSDTMSANERMAINREVEQLTRQTVALTNTTYKGDYVFAGTQTKIMPFPLHASSTSLEDYDNFKMAVYDATPLVVNTPVQLYDAFTNEPIDHLIPGTFKLSVGGTTYNEGVHFTVDYANGQITILPAGAPTLCADVLNGSIAGVDNYSVNGFKINFEYIGKGKDIYGDTADTSGKIFREVESGVTAQINIPADVLTFDATTNTHLLSTLIEFGNSLIRNDLAGIRSSISGIDQSMKTIRAAQTTNGARINRFETTLERNETQQSETAKLQSELEDAEMAETMTKFATAQAVYNAALQSASKIIQNSLVNFL